MGKLFTQSDQITVSNNIQKDSFFTNSQNFQKIVKAPNFVPEKIHIFEKNSIWKDALDLENPSTSDNSPTSKEKTWDFPEPTYSQNPLSVSAQRQLLIDVKPKRKTFQTEEEKKKFIDGFTQKKKTELCKNWELNGSCKYGNNCSFAHGKSELKSKTHLNSNYKQKPCKQFLIKGICYYGNRCQYLHGEIKYYPEHKDFLMKAQKKTGLALNSLVNFTSEVSLLKKMEKNYEKMKDAEKFLLSEKKNGERKRLPIFSNLSL